jgi:rhodanese-related sulfurtransferase
MKQVVDVCPTTALGMIERGALLVDVREPDEVAGASFAIPDVMLVPFSEFEDRFREIPADRDVIIGCTVGERSLRAAGFLMHHGYERVFNMQDGIVRWAEKGYPLHGSLTAKSHACCCGGTSHGAANNGGKCC